MTLKGKTVVARPLRKKDIPLIIGWYSSPEVRKLELFSGPIKEENFVTDLQEKKFLIYGDGAPVGFATLEVIKGNRWADVGIVIGEPFWGRGYGQEAMNLIILYCFDTLNLNRIQLTTYSHNIRAQKFFKKLGFKKEGIRREFFRYKGNYYDAILMAILKKEWNK